MNDIIEFLRARIAEDATRAKIASEASRSDESWWELTGSIYERLESDQTLAKSFRHIDKHSPARVLAECAAKRAIIDHLSRIPWDCEPAGDRDYMKKFLFILAQPYKHQPGFQAEWAV
jgi:hypothetical protein